MRATVPGCRRARAHHAAARLHHRRLRPVLGHAVLGRCARRLPRCHRRPDNPRRLPSTRPLTINTTTLGTGTFMVVSLLEWPSCGITSQNHYKGACPQCGGLEHVDETASKHAICSSGTQKRIYLHRNQNETSARRLMRNFAATVRYYPYSIKLAAHGAPRTTPFFSINWRKHELHAESSRRAQGPLSRAA